MKVMFLAAVIELPDNDTKNDPAPVPKPTPFSPDELLRKLFLEAKTGRNPEIWSNFPNGPIFEV